MVELKLLPRINSVLVAAQDQSLNTTNYQKVICGQQV